MMVQELTPRKREPTTGENIARFLGSAVEGAGMGLKPQVEERGAQQKKGAETQQNQLRGMQIAAGIASSLGIPPTDKRIQGAAQILASDPSQVKNILSDIRNSLIDEPPEAPSPELSAPGEKPVGPELGMPKEGEQLTEKIEDTQIGQAGEGQPGASTVKEEIGVKEPKGPSWKIHSDEKIERAQRYNPERAKMMVEQNKNARKEFEENRKFHTDQSKKAAEKYEKITDDLPKVNMSIQSAEDAINSGKVGAFSLNYLADLFDSPALRDASGAQLASAQKEFVFSSLSRVSARGLNQWMEKQIKDFFPKAGQSKYANMAMLEALKGERDLQQLYADTYSRLEEEQKSEHGHRLADIDSRVKEEISPKQKEIFRRAAREVQRIKDQQMGDRRLKEEAVKKQEEGAPLTKERAEIIRQKVKEKGDKVPWGKVAAQLNYQQPEEGWNSIFEDENPGQKAALPKEGEPAPPQEKRAEGSGAPGRAISGVKTPKGETINLPEGTVLQEETGFLISPEGKKYRMKEGFEVVR